MLLWANTQYWLTWLRTVILKKKIKGVTNLNSEGLQHSQGMEVWHEGLGFVIKVAWRSSEVL